MATSGALTIGVNAVPPIPPRLVIEKQAPCISWGLSFLLRAFSASSCASSASSQMPFWSTSRITGTMSPGGRIHGNADMAVVLLDNFPFLHINGHVKGRHVPQVRRAQALSRKAIGVSLTPRFSPSLLCDFAEVLQVGDVRILELGDVGHIEPAALHIDGGGRMHPLHRAAFNLAELAEVRQLDRRQAAT